MTNRQPGKRKRKHGGAHKSLAPAKIESLPSTSVLRGRVQILRGMSKQSRLYESDHVSTNECDCNSAVAFAHPGRSLNFSGCIRKDKSLSKYSDPSDSKRAALSKLTPTTLAGKKGTRNSLNTMKADEKKELRRQQWPACGPRLQTSRRRGLPEFRIRVKASF